MKNMLAYKWLENPDIMEFYQSFKLERKYNMNRLTNRIRTRIRTDIQNTKETTWLTIVIFCITYCIFTAFINLVVFKQNYLGFIPDLTMGIMNETLTANWVNILLFVFILILIQGKLSICDIGLKKNRFLSAVLAVITIWVILQLLNIAVAVVIDGKPVIYSGWNKYGAPYVIGSFIAQILGNALFEEIAFRGFLLVQLSKKCGNKKPNIILGLVISQLIFALIHVPNRILNGMSILEILPSLLIVFLLGVFFSIIYLFTDNLFLAVGIHSLWNMPLLIFDGLQSIWVVMAMSIVLVIAWEAIIAKLSFKSETSPSL
ncbi:MAG TPA: type II CAAX endopeptidase family protein [Pseudobacteroides sp.]|uniref:CPBP family intramembrane glutamic endopeptidase n=1 Tax=Pseudobacteroides sp. TaxID=1968840 RepID=UPI002F95EF24